MQRNLKLIVVFLLSLPILSVYGKENGYFSQKEIGKVTEGALRSFYSKNPENICNTDKKKIEKNVKKSKEAIIKRLKNYKVSGMSFCLDGNIAFLYDNQDPIFDVAFKNHEGDVKYRRMAFNFTSLGLNVQLGFNINLLFFVNTDLDFFASRKKTYLSGGASFAIGIPSAPVNAGVTYLSFDDKPGGAIIFSLGIFALAYKLVFLTGGWIKPLKI